MAEHEYYLAGPCEGMSFHRTGREVRFKDSSGREPETNHIFKDEERAWQTAFRMEAQAMTSARIEASHQATRAIHQTVYQGCPHCQRRLSIAEQIERHCDDCGKEISPRDIREERE